MKPYYKKIYFFTLLLFALNITNSAHAALYGADQAAQTAGIPPGSQTSVVAIVANIVSAGLGLIGVLFFILTVYGGITWMVARGNEEYTKRALNTIMAAVIGLIIVVAAYAITQFVFTSITGS